MSPLCFKSQGGHPYSHLFTLGIGIREHIMQSPSFTSGVTPANLLVTSMAAEPFSSTYLYIRIEFSSDFQTACKRSAKSTYCSQTFRCFRLSSHSFLLPHFILQTQRYLTDDFSIKESFRWYSMIFSGVYILKRFIFIVIQ